jgi:hypothetical protein
MRRYLLAGIVLAVATGLVVLIGAALELDTEGLALLGCALGAVVAMVPDRTPTIRLSGFAAGFVAAWLGYVGRAALLPDTSAGRAVAVVIVVLLCVALFVALRARLPLWSLLLGAAGFTGAYEFTYATAPPELMTTSVSTASALFLSVAVGFCAAATAGTADTGHADPAPTPRSRVSPTPDGETDEVRLDNLMETSK